MGITIGRHLFSEFEDLLVYENAETSTGSIFFYDSDFLLGRYYISKFCEEEHMF